MGVAVLTLRHVSGLRRTRKSVTESLGVLRRDGQQPEVGRDGERPQISRDGRPAEVAAPEPR